MKTLTHRETTTVLAALRFYDIATKTPHGQGVPLYVAHMFTDVKPMFGKDIDKICDKLSASPNFDGKGEDA